MKRICPRPTFLLCVLPLSAVAGTKHSATINISDPVVVNGTHRKPGDYTVRWNGTGSDVRVQFVQGKKEVVSVPAKSDRPEQFRQSGGHHVFGRGWIEDDQRNRSVEGDAAIPLKDGISVEIARATNA
jgi:hypothetical protein